MYSEYIGAEAVMLCLLRGPIRSSSSQPCCKHHYFTPPSLSLFLSLVLQKGQFTVPTMQLHRAKKGNKKGDMRRGKRYGLEGGRDGATELERKVQEQHTNCIQ